MTVSLEELQRLLDNEREQNRKLQNLIRSYANQIQELSRNQCQCSTQTPTINYTRTKYGHPLPYSREVAWIKGQSDG